MAGIHGNKIVEIVLSSDESDNVDKENCRVKRKKSYHIIDNGKVVFIPDDDYDDEVTAFSGIRCRLCYWIHTTDNYTNGQRCEQQIRDLSTKALNMAMTYLTGNKPSAAIVVLDTISTAMFGMDIPDSSQLCRSSTAGKAFDIIVPCWIEAAMHAKVDKSLLAKAIERIHKASEHGCKLFQYQAKSLNRLLKDLKSFGDPLVIKCLKGQNSNCELFEQLEIAKVRLEILKKSKRFTEAINYCLGVGSTCVPSTGSTRVLPFTKKTRLCDQTVPMRKELIELLVQVGRFNEAANEAFEFYFDKCCSGPYKNFVYPYLHVSQMVHKNISTLISTKLMHGKPLDTKDLKPPEDCQITTEIYVIEILSILAAMRTSLKVAMSCLARKFSADANKLGIRDTSLKPLEIKFLSNPSFKALEAIKKTYKQKEENKYLKKREILLQFLQKNFSHFEEASIDIYSNLEMYEELKICLAVSKNYETICGKIHILLIKAYLSTSHDVKHKLVDATKDCISRALVWGSFYDSFRIRAKPLYLDNTVQQHKRIELEEWLIQIRYTFGSPSKIPGSAPCPIMMKFESFSYEWETYGTESRFYVTKETLDCLKGQVKKLWEHALNVGLRCPL
ncbi:hypothetical protein QZH41_000806 [Actinostola sp. cb2023]|nr:hypothetical protein QZH41_000806 [Actinostola sp. cb2023]